MSKYSVRPETPPQAVMPPSRADRHAIATETVPAPPSHADLKHISVDGAFESMVKLRDAWQQALLDLQDTSPNAGDWLDTAQEVRQRAHEYLNACIHFTATARDI